MLNLHPPSHSMNKWLIPAPYDMISITTLGHNLKTERYMHKAMKWLFLLCWEVIYPLSWRERARKVDIFLSKI